MANTSLLLYYCGHLRFSPSFMSLFFVPTCLALFSSLFILFYISITSNLFSAYHHHHHNHHHPTILTLKPHLPSGSSSNTQEIGVPVQIFNVSKNSYVRFPRIGAWEKTGGGGGNESQRSFTFQLGSDGIYVNNEVFHERDIFLEGYKEMNRSFKINVYPHRRHDPYANTLLPVDFKPGGNYASESFEKVLMKSHFITKDPKELIYPAKNVRRVPLSRPNLWKRWSNDTEFFVHLGRLTTPYADEILGSKFCLHVKGFEVNTARIVDSLYYGCVPVIIADHYDLLFTDILNWKSFSIIVATLDIPLLKKILREITSDKYLMLQNNVMKV